MLAGSLGGLSRKLLETLGMASGSGRVMSNMLMMVLESAGGNSEHSCCMFMISVKVL